MNTDLHNSANGKDHRYYIFLTPKEEETMIIKRAFSIAWLCGELICTLQTYNIWYDDFYLQ